MKLFKIIGFATLLILGFTSMGIVDISTFRKKGENQKMKILNYSSFSLKPSAYVGWVQSFENGLKQIKTIGEIDFLLQFKPHDYMVCQEIKSDLISKKLHNMKLKEYEGYEYYELKMKLNNESGDLLKHKLIPPDTYKNRVEYYSFKMANDISLVDNNDTLPCSLFHFERSFESSPYSTFLIGFVNKKNRKKLKERTILFNEKIFGKGVIVFSISQEKLLNIPKLKTL